MLDTLTDAIRRPAVLVLATLCSLSGAVAAAQEQSPNELERGAVRSSNPRGDLDPSRGLAHRDRRNRALHGDGEAARVLSGVVRDRSGEAIPRVRVTLAWGDDPIFGSRSSENPNRDEGRRLQRTDRDGRFAFDVGSLHRTSGRLHLTRAGYRDVEVDVSWLSGSPPADVILDEPGAVVDSRLVYLNLSGRVLDEDGNPVADARVLARDPAGGDFSVHTRSDAEGRYELTLWGAPARAAFRVEKDPFVPLDALLTLGGSAQSDHLVQLGSYDFDLRRHQD